MPKGDYESPTNPCPNNIGRADDFNFLGGFGGTLNRLDRDVGHYSGSAVATMELHTYHSIAFFSLLSVLIALCEQFASLSGMHRPSFITF
jgi:hypothetical protein